MHFKTDEKVLFLHESGGGVVKSYKTNNIVIVEDEETGFDRELLESDLTKVYGDQSNILNEDFDVNDIIEETASHRKNIGDVWKHKDFWEIDLHTHVLLESEKGLTNGELLNHQMLEFKRFFRKAKEKYIRKLVVIHGVGEGVLKSEIRHFLEGKEGLEFYDSDFRKYGKGATTVRLYYR